MERVDDPAVPAPEREHPETREEVEISVAFVVDEIAALALLVEASEFESAQHPWQLGVDVLGMQTEVLTTALGQQLRQIKWHACSSTVRVPPRGGQVSGGFRGPVPFGRLFGCTFSIHAMIPWRACTRTRVT